MTEKGFISTTHSPVKTNIKIRLVFGQKTGSFLLKQAEISAKGVLYLVQPLN